MKRARQDCVTFGIAAGHVQGTSNNDDFFVGSIAGAAGR
jgi:hypothetical protein